MRSIIALRFINDENIAASASRAVKINQDRGRRKKSSQASGCEQ